MGYSPAEVDQMSAWEFLACCDGYGGSAPSGGGAEDIDEEALREMGIRGF